MAKTSLTVGYDIDNLTNPEIAKAYRGAVTIDRYGRKMPKHAHGTVNLKGASSSSKVILEAVMDLFDRIYLHIIRQYKQLLFHRANKL